MQSVESRLWNMSVMRWRTRRRRRTAIRRPRRTEPPAGIGEQHMDEGADGDRAQDVRPCKRGTGSRPQGADEEGEPGRDQRPRAVLRAAGFGPSALQRRTTSRPTGRGCWSDRVLLMAAREDDRQRSGAGRQRNGADRQPTRAGDFIPAARRVSLTTARPWGRSRGRRRSPRATRSPSVPARGEHDAGDERSRHRASAGDLEPVHVGELDVEEHERPAAACAPPRSREAPSAASPTTSKPSASSSARAVRRKLGWSSTMRTVLGMHTWWHVECSGAVRVTTLFVGLSSGRAPID